ncbi:MAG: parvulin-like peptidyl-prolyl isomerase [Chlamydiales bacterium]|jgi:parvulin-like peptidyl-prolyl isomerase
MQTTFISIRAPWIALCIACLQACGTTHNRRMDEGKGDTARVSHSSPGAGSSPQAAGTSSEAVLALPNASVSASASGEADATIATVAGHPIVASELLELWLFRESPKVRAYLEELVLSKLVLTEAHRIEISLATAVLDEAVAQSLEALGQKLQEGELDLDVDQFIQQRLGLNPQIYRARLRAETEIDLLAERCVRAWLLQSERAQVRVIVVEDRDAVDVVQAKLDQGVDFGLLADEHSIEGSGSDGGRVPPVVRSGVALSRLAFSTPIGKVGGPVLEQERYLFLKVDERSKAVEGTWKELRDPVEASLRERGIEDPEYWQWKTAMLERYSVDMTPFLDLVGEPAGP